MEVKQTVIQFIDSLFRGGAQKVVLDIVEALPDCRHIVCYWADETDLKPEMEQLGVTLIRIPFHGMWSFPYTWYSVYKVVRQYKPHYLHSHMFVPNLLTRTIPRKNFKVFATYHGECLEGTFLKSQIIRWLERRLLHRSDKLIAVSRYIKEYLQLKLKTLHEIEVIHNYGRKGRQAVLQPYLPLRMVSTANNHPYKNYPLLLKAMHQLRDQPVTLTIYGQRMDDMKKVAEELSLQNVQFKNSVPDVTQEFNLYNMFAILSKGGEGFSLALLEAMNSGLAIVCTNIPQFTEAVAKEALIVSPNEVEDLVNQVRELIEYPEKLQYLSAATLQRAKLFSRPIFVTRIRTLYGKSTVS